MIILIGVVAVAAIIAQVIIAVVGLRLAARIWFDDDSD